MRPRARSTVTRRLTYTYLSTTHGHIPLALHVYGAPLDEAVAEHGEEEELTRVTQRDLEEGE
jgi:hypothetical protein